MRIRTVKPEFFLHDGLFDAERSSGLPLRIAFIGLWCAVDRQGRFKWEPRRLSTCILPYDGVDFAKVLAELARIGLVVRYGAAGEFGHVPTFLKHQHVNKHEAESILPQPPDTTAYAPTLTHVQEPPTPPAGCPPAGLPPIETTGSGKAHVDAHARTLTNVHERGEGNGREGNRKGMETLAAADADRGGVNSESIIEFLRIPGDEADPETPPEGRQEPPGPGEEPADYGNGVPDRPRNLPFEAVCEVSGLDHRGLTKGEGGKVGKALQGIVGSLCAMGWKGDGAATGAEIRRRAKNYRANMPGIALTPTGLENNWGRCNVATPPKGPEWAEIQKLEFTIGRHAANPEASGFNESKVTREQRDELRALRSRLREIKTVKIEPQKS